MAEKLIPGIPHASRIAILQQTDVESRDDGVEDARTGASGSEGNNKGRTVLEYAMGSDKSAKDIVRKATSKPCELYVLGCPDLIMLDPDSSREKLRYR